MLGKGLVVKCGCQWNMVWQTDAVQPRLPDDLAAWPQRRPSLRRKTANHKLAKTNEVLERQPSRLLSRFRKEKQTLTYQMHSKCQLGKAAVL